MPQITLFIYSFPDSLLTHSRPLPRTPTRNGGSLNYESVNVWKVVTRNSRKHQRLSSAKRILFSHQQTYIIFPSTLFFSLRLIIILYTTMHAANGTAFTVYSLIIIIVSKYAGWTSDKTGLYFPMGRWLLVDLVLLNAYFKIITYFIRLFAQQWGWTNTTTVRPCLWRITHHRVHNGRDLA